MTLAIALAIVAAILLLASFFIFAKRRFALAIIFMAAVLGSVFLSIQNWPSRSERFLMNLQSQLPISIDSNTTLVAIEKSHSQLLFTFQRSDFSAAELKPQQYADLLQLGLTSYVCQYAKRHEIIATNLPVHFRYLTKDRVVLPTHEVFLRACDINPESTEAAGNETTPPNG
ncbi:hypothetical protein [Permianibacter aggregans]|uniref:Uncharacterized protein n=1 Tax=Permianibacter aggregans TaxID=1510150 RepID=A0A4R6U7Z6_9GAMM|nr:hypothetical protein [Permianibacter aggregans]QGX39855.1 hypothetical protein E2H98_09370 [Permianibacter aggregans]TDQ41822.1 hypothetical protein EV696_1382 [Permianibacter aggregans]